MFCPNRDETAYLHLLWDHELAALSRIFEAIAPNRDYLLAQWHRKYSRYYGDCRSLAEGDFRRIFGVELDAIIEALLVRNVDRFTAAVRASGEMLRGLAIPFPELIVATFLFQDSASDAVAKCPTHPSVSSLGKLAHCKIILLADAYLRAHNPLLQADTNPVALVAVKPLAEPRTNFRGIVGSSRPMSQLYSKIEAAARTRGTVLIIGESGTGKELVARALHECGRDPAAPFVPLNCAALPRDLTESELFGYRRGAFSGARDGYLGLFRAADGGTLFLDDITEMSLDLQAKMLRAIQERSVRPVGLTSEIPVDVRIIASTNQDPLEALRRGHLREDLYYRLQANVLRVPSVRERPGDVGALAKYYLDFFNRKMGRHMTAIGHDATAAMEAYSWPGNVREIANTIESAFTFGRGPSIAMSDLPIVIQKAATTRSIASVRDGARPHSVPTYAEVERELFSRALASSRGNRSVAAKLLQVSRKKLYDKIVKYHLA